MSEILDWLRVMIAECDNNIREGIMVEYWRGQKEAYQFTIDKIVLNQTKDV